MLVIFEPSTLPMTISEVPLATDTKEETSSGRLVPKPTIRTPITKGGRLKNVPISSADTIKRSDDFIRTARLTANINTHAVTLIVYKYISGNTSTQLPLLGDSRNCRIGAVICALIFRFRWFTLISFYH